MKQYAHAAVALVSNAVRLDAGLINLFLVKALLRSVSKPKV